MNSSPKWLTYAFCTLFCWGIFGFLSKLGSNKLSPVQMQIFFTVGLLILSLSPAGGAPHVSNFGQPFPAIQFWTVPELRAAWSHLIGSGRTTWNDWQILLYTAGRAMLWVVVISAIFSMYGYFRAFFGSVVRREEPTAKPATAAAVQYHER